ncbi:hypothetical protein D1224_15685 [Henriciella barbarensis]|uniref:Type I restriction modification DNA specificity domain-containing protein n=1 Tax=Henriciella barbarensis TaxID=86342 RepID=A0A399QNU6_9PROT|nr:restriction endonuclease subunit S [Henriciella barbarensis]RIJ20550.1 hypothetical protein D1224_15685 [Henriciella barbarensis]
MSGLPSNWSETDLANCCEGDAPIIYGILQPKDNVSDGVPYVRPTEIDQTGRIDRASIRRTSPEIADRYRRSTLQTGDIILSIVGTIGKIARVPEWLSGGNITQSSCRIRFDKQLLDADFATHFLKSPLATDQYGGSRLGTAVPRLNLADVRKFRVPLPPLAEQKRIVEKLDSLTTASTEARTALTRVETLVEQYRQAVLLAGARGKLTTDWRTNNHPLSVPELLQTYTPPEQPRGGRVASDSVVDGIGGLALNAPERELPEGWQWAALNHLARQETGHTPSRSKPEYWHGGIKWIGIKDARLHHGQTIYETLQTVSQAGLDNSASRLLPAGTVCLSRTASVGYVFIMGEEMATSQDFVTWTCGELLVPKYLMYVLMAEGDAIRRFGKGTTHTTIYFPEVRAMHIALPPPEEQEVIVRRVEEALTQIDTLANAARSSRGRLDKLDRAVLAKAFRGELVPQDPKDEPASELLKRLHKEPA